MRANCWKATGGRPCEPCGGLQRRPAGDYAAPRGNCVGGEGITLPIQRQGDFVCAVLNCAGYSRRASRAVARELCEEFAPRDGTTRAREEGGANRARKPKTKGSRGVEREPCRPAGLQSRNSCPEVRARKPKIKGLRGVEREPCRPRGLQPRNSRPEVRARKPKTKGLRGVEREPCQPQGSLCLPEAPSPCRPGGPIPLPEGPSHFRRTPTKKRRAAARRFPLSY